VRRRVLHAVGPALSGAVEGPAPARQEVGPHAPAASAVARESAAAGQARYKGQFTADPAYVDGLEHARALLWHKLPSGDLAQLQRFALEALLEKLVLRKYGAGARSAMIEERSRSAAADAGSDEAARSEAPASPAAEGLVETQPSSLAAEPSDATHSAPARCTSSRHVPAAVRSAVWLRDAARCTFVDARGVRCRATTALELHHERPFARGGAATTENLRLHCRAHNDLAANQDFGRHFMLARKHGATKPRQQDDASAKGPT